MDLWTGTGTKMGAHARASGLPILYPGYEEVPQHEPFRMLHARLQLDYGRCIATASDALEVALGLKPMAQRVWGEPGGAPSNGTEARRQRAEIASGRTGQRSG
jgi:hypothetical protein